MKRSIMLKWVKRLENPRSKQAFNGLRGIKDKQAMCCLGHLCKVMGFKFDKRGYVILPKGEVSSATILPPYVAKKAGMKSREGHYIQRSNVPSISISLATDNDAGVSLADIAKTIRKHWREL